MKNRCYTNRLLWSLADQGHAIAFKHDNGKITCVISKGKRESSAQSKDVSTALNIAWSDFQRREQHD